MDLIETTLLQQLQASPSETQKTITGMRLAGAYQLDHPIVQLRLNMR
jgi:hypothetical protein